MAYIGKEFKPERQENYEAFIDAVNAGRIDEQQRQILINNKSSIKLLKSGDGYILQTIKPDKSTKDESFVPGVEYEETIGGNTSKNTVTVNGNVFTKVMKFTEGTITATRVFTDNELVVTYTCDLWDGKAVKYYKA